MCMYIFLDKMKFIFEGNTTHRACRNKVIYKIELKLAQKRRRENERKAMKGEVRKIYEHHWGG